jgi:hypothetical protein
MVAKVRADSVAGIVNLQHSFVGRVEIQTWPEAASVGGLNIVMRAARTIAGALFGARP